MNDTQELIEEARRRQEQRLNPIDFIREVAAQALGCAQNLLECWLPDGKLDSGEFVAINPTRADNDAGSFKVNIRTGLWSDFATGDAGGDLVSCRAYIDGCSQYEAARRIHAQLGGNITPIQRRVSAPKQPHRKADQIKRFCATEPPTPKKLYVHYLGGEPSCIWTYRDHEGRVCGAIARFETAEGKTIRPFRPSESLTSAQYPQHRHDALWVQGAMEKLRPLYNLPELLARPDAIIVVCEGEKAADAARELFPNCVVTTSAGGANAAKHSDWSPITGRTLIYWPDHDEPGRKYIEIVHELAQPVKAYRLSPAWLCEKLGKDALPVGYDAADAVEDGLDALDVMSGLDEWREVEVPCVPPSAPSDDARAAAFVFAKDFNALSKGKRKERQPDLLRPENADHLNALKFSLDESHRNEVDILLAHIGTFKREVEKAMRLRREKNEAAHREASEKLANELRGCIIRPYVVGDPELMADMTRLQSSGGNADEAELAELDRQAEQEAVIPKFTHPYSTDESGITWNKVKEGSTTRIRLSNFQARIAEDRFEDDGVETRHTFKIDASITYGEDNRIHRSETIPATQFRSLNWVAGILGADAIISPGQGIREHLPAAIQSMSFPTPKRHVITHIGWRDHDGKPVYLHTGGAIGVDGPIAGIDVELPKEIAAFRLPEPPEADDLKIAVRATLRFLEVAPRRITMPLLASVSRAAIMTADFALHLQGLTGTRKSELAARAQQFFGAGMDARHLPGSWSSTGNSLGALAFLAKDALAVIDDFKPEGSKIDIDRAHRDAATVFRAQGNGKTRGRMRQDGTLQPDKPPRGLLLSTGEDTPRGHSIRARMVVIEVKPDDVNLDRLTQAQRDGADGLYAAAMAGFVRWLAGDLEAHRAELKARAAQLRDEIIKTGSHGRTADASGQLQAGFELWMRYAVDVGAMTAQEASRAAKECWAVLRQLADDQAVTQAEADPVERFRRLLAAAMMSGKAHMTGADGETPPHWAGPVSLGWRERYSSQDLDTGELHVTYQIPNGSPWVGFVDQTGFYLQPEAAYSAATTQARAADEGLGMSAEALWSRMRDAGLLVSTDPEKGRGRNTIRKIYAGRRQRWLHLRPDFFDVEDETPQPDKPASRLNVVDLALYAERPSRAQKQPVVMHQSFAVVDHASSDEAFVREFLS